jgi:two-component system, cell cycle sensor histidine kinase and response regulator CckA
MDKDDAVGHLAGGIARDFEQLLTAIIGHAETLGEYLSPGDPRATEVAAIRQAAERACSLTEQLFAFSRTRAPRPRIVDANAVIGRARSTVERMVGDHIRLELRLAADARPVRVDGEILQQLLYNLALSARDAMPDGGVLTVSSTNVAIAPGDARARDVDPGEYLEVSVTDSGAAIDSSAQPYLFEPSLEPSPRHHAPGLGLAIAHGLIRQAGGHIDVESPLAGTTGSRAVVLLPAAAHGALHAVERREQHGGADTVLVAADDPNLRALIMAVLRRRGYGVLGAHDAWQATRLASEHDDAIDLLITTTTMNGRVIADAFRGARPDTRVLFVGVSSAEPDAVGREREFANEALLTQPFTPDALARKVRGLLTAARVHLEMRILPK